MVHKPASGLKMLDNVEFGHFTMLFYNARAKPMFCSLNVLFSHIPADTQAKGSHDKGILTIISLIRCCCVAFQSLILHLQIVQLRLVFPDRGFKTTF